MEKEPVQKPEKETTKEKKAEKKHPAQEKVEELERQLKEQKDLLLRTACLLYTSTVEVPQEAFMSVLELDDES